MKRSPQLLCAILLLALLTPAQAALLTFEFSGTVTQVPLDDVFGDIAAGDPIQGYFTFDPSATDQVPDPATGVFSWSAPIGALAVNAGAHVFEASGSLTVGVLNSFVDQYTVLGLSDASGTLTVELFLQDNTGAAFASDQLPVAPPSLSAFTQRDFHLRAVIDGAEVQVDGQLHSLTVPEPSTAGLMLAGAAFLLLARRRRRI